MPANKGGRTAEIMDSANSNQHAGANRRRVTQYGAGFIRAKLRGGIDTLEERRAVKARARLAAVKAKYFGSVLKHTL